jgi:hypothetical protein
VFSRIAASTTSGVGVIACVLAVAVGASACTTTVPGHAGRLGSSLGLPPVPVIPDEPARWAVSELDPCALARGAPIATARRAYAIRPHSCAAEYGPPGVTEWWQGSSGELFARVGAEIITLPRLVVHVGAGFDIADRSKMARVEFAGRTAYQAFGKHFPAPEISALGDLCRIDIPISADRSVRIVSAAAPGGDVGAACAAPRAVAETVASKLVSPASSVRTSPGGLGRWDACDLLERATGYGDTGVSPLPRPNADRCLASGPGAGPALEIDTIAGPDSLEPDRFGGGTRVELPFGPALQHEIGADQCEVAFVAERQPDAPPEYAAQITTVRLAGAPGDPCAGAADAAVKIRGTMSGPAPQPPPAPARLGFAIGEPDAEMPAACGVFAALSADTCRTPRPVPVPATAPELLRAGETVDAPDVSCAVLRDAAAPVTGEGIELAAAMNESGGGCIGLTGEAYRIYLAFFSGAAAGEYCMGAEKQTVQVAGRSAVRCSGPGTFNLYVAATGALDAPGVVLVEAGLVAPRGDMSWDAGAPDPAAAARMAEGTTRVAENVVTQRLAR